MSEGPARFVVSTGRCGSTLLSRMLSCHPRVLSLSEVFAALAPNAFPDGSLSGEAFWRLIATPSPEWTDAVRRGLEPEEWRYPLDAGGRWSREAGVPPILAITLPSLVEDPDALYADLGAVVPDFPPGPVAGHYRALFDLLADRLGRDVWVERSGGSLAYAEPIARAFPEARIVHLHRDGRETALSMRDHPYFRLPLLAPGADAAAEVAIERLGRRWSATVIHGLRGLDRSAPGRVLHVDYDELVGDPVGVLAEIAAFLALPEAGGGWLGEAAALVVPQPLQWPVLPEPERTQLDRACAVGERRRLSLA